MIDSLKKEMNNTEVSFDIKEDGTPIPDGYKEDSGNLVWNVKMNLTHKALCIKDGHKSDDP